MRRAILWSLLVLAACSTVAPPRVDHVGPAPSGHAATPSEISAAVHDRDNQAGVKSCYERALKTAGRAITGRVTVTVHVSRSGVVQRVALATRSELNTVAPCIRTAISHWAFPANTTDYAAQFPLVLQSR